MDMTSTLMIRVDTFDRFYSDHRVVGYALVAIFMDPSGNQVICLAKETERIARVMDCLRSSLVLYIGNAEIERAPAKIRPYMLFGHVGQDLARSPRDPTVVADLNMHGCPQMGQAARARLRTSYVAVRRR